MVTLQFYFVGAFIYLLMLMTNVRNKWLYYWDEEIDELMNNGILLGSLLILCSIFWIIVVPFSCYNSIKEERRK